MVFNFGKKWGCVVLLDESNAFLEQRGLRDLYKNVLVSSFLPRCEYYKGTLALIDNRVGKLDESFSSRIQFAMYYPDLNQFQRRRIWETFFNRLESFKDESTEILDLRAHLEELSLLKMNGREIRNVVTATRQYAECNGDILSFAQAKECIVILHSSTII